MSSTTPNLSLTLYDSTTDQSVSFATFRAVWGGPALTSNFYKIDTAYGVQAAQIATLNANKGAISVPSSFISANYYEASAITAITAYATNMNIILSVDTTSSGTVTLNINALGTKSVSKVDSTGAIINLTGSDLVKGRQYLFTYNGTQWLWVSANSADQIQIVGTSGNVVTVGSTNNLDGTLTQSLLVSQTIHAATAKTTIADADEFGQIDSAASNVLKRITWANFATAIGVKLGTIFDALTGKTTPVDADEFAIADSDASFASKKLTWANLKATLKTYFDGLYMSLTGTFALPSDISPSQITSNQNDYNPTGLSTASTLRINSDAARDITGLAGGADGRILAIHNIGSFTITLKNNNVSSSAANRFLFPADTTIASNSSVVLQYDSTASFWKLFGGSGGGGGITLSSASPRIYTSGATWTKPTGLSYVIVEIVGGGGGGGGCTGGASSASVGAAGGGGEYGKMKILASSLGSTETITIGAGGTAGSSPAGTGGNGGTTSFGSLVTAVGGGGGSGQSAVTAVPLNGGTGVGAGGTGGTGGDYHIAGSSGLVGILWSITSTVSGVGGQSFMSGTVTLPGIAGDEAGANGLLYGGGACGGRSSSNASSFAGGVGGGGVCIVWEYVSS